MSLRHPLLYTELYVQHGRLVPGQKLFGLWRTCRSNLIDRELEIRLCQFQSKLGRRRRRCKANTVARRSSYPCKDHLGERIVGANNLAACTVWLHGEMRSLRSSEVRWCAYSGCGLVGAAN